jgi:hypothetical protein
VAGTNRHHRVHATRLWRLGQELQLVDVDMQLKNVNVRAASQLRLHKS